MSTIPLHEMVVLSSRFATGALASAMWQGALLGGAAALGLRLVPETPARVRFAIWFSVFVLVLALPLSLPVIWGQHENADSNLTASSHAWFTLNERWCFWIAGLWAAASAGRAVMLGISAWRVRELWRHARAVELAPVPSASGRKLQLCTSDEVDRPAVIGFFAPKIVMPQWLLDKLTPAELEQVVLHEAGHLSRKDDWLNLVQKLALVVFPLNPALAWIERRLCLERELACDERVLGATGAPIAYAECLARIAEYRLERKTMGSGLALALAAIGRESELGRRVRSLLNAPPAMKQTHARRVLSGAMALLMLAAGVLERTPRLVAFTNSDQQTANANQPAAGIPGFRVVPVRVVATSQEWRTVGDAPRVSAAAPSVVRVKARPRVATPKMMAELVPPQAGDVRTDAVQATDGMPSERAGLMQTVATTRELTADGGVVIMRWVTFLRNQDSPAAEPERSSPIAAVPVQGGWLLIQL